jgi:hypothetical protein
MDRVYDRLGASGWRPDLWPTVVAQLLAVTSPIIGERVGAMVAEQFLVLPSPPQFPIVLGVPVKIAVPLPEDARADEAVHGFTARSRS